MNRKSWLSAVFWAVSFGGLVAILTGQQRAVSLQVWLAAVVIWFASASVRRMLEGVPLVPSRIRSLISFRRGPAAVETARRREMRALEGLLLRASSNDRAYAVQLRPRVVALADHFLQVNYGLDRQSHPERVADLLGPLGWMLESDTQQRIPTLDELDDLVELLVVPTSTPNKEAA